MCGSQRKPPGELKNPGIGPATNDGWGCFHNIKIAVDLRRKGNTSERVHQHLTRLVILRNGYTLHYEPELLPDGNNAAFRRAEQLKPIGIPRFLPERGAGKQQSGKDACDGSGNGHVGWPVAARALHRRQRRSEEGANPGGQTLTNLAAHCQHFFVVE